MFEVVSSASAAPHKWQSFMDDENYLIPSKLFDWFYGLVARALKSLNLREVTLQRAGPSANLIINKPGVREMSVDLAPTIQMLGVPPGIHFPDSWPDREKMKSIPGVMRSNSLWQLCTKEHMGAVFSGNRRWWRISTSPLEKYVLDTIDRDGGGDSSGGGCRKQILRLLKLLREVEGSNWLGIKSYHLKHLVMSESCRHVDWSVGKIDVCFVGCLRTLENSLQEQNLRNVFFPKMNMFSELSVTNNLAFRVKRIAKNIERDPNEAKKYFEN
ncbi:cyclic GMP-AMP synthase-like receptor 3 [Saccoglossus kowalevskii]|uniref:Protein mab-21-like 1-like n=1 Tax=Saccoglossus kowalevskii TaxID=10224 RepID=A0ABM0MN46_SACKO|nr:PREDICTED: protein mab-21-like 1-like [Saccoglossus kowalevskii]